MPETALENVKKTIARRESKIIKGKTIEGARGYQFSNSNLLEEIKELSKIKNMEKGNYRDNSQVGMVNILTKSVRVNGISKQMTSPGRSSSNTTESLRTNKRYNCVKGPAIDLKDFQINIKRYPDTLIYQSAKRKGFKEDGSRADDMKCNDYSTKELVKINKLFQYEIDRTEEELFIEFKDMCITLFAQGEMEKVIKDMIKHFKEGNGKDYSNKILTKNVKNHDDTKRYIKEVRKHIIQKLNENKGNIINMKYEYSNRGENTLYDIIQKNVERIIFNSFTDKVTGLTIAINDTWGNKIEIINYMVIGNEYKGQLKFTIYDHFGLDLPDVEKVLYVNLGGFRAWFTLQHWKKFDGKYKPFASVMSFNIPFGGTLE